MTVLFEQKQPQFQAILARYPNKQAALLPVLWLAQEERGYLSNETLKEVASLLDLSPIHVLSVATFYTMYHLQPPGKHHIQVCRTLSCALMGSDSILDYIKKKLNIDEGEVTTDKKFSLCTVECLASCGTGPMMMINEKYYENLNPQKIDQILESLT